MASKPTAFVITVIRSSRVPREVLEDGYGTKESAIQRCRTVWDQRGHEDFMLSVGPAFPKPRERRLWAQFSGGPDEAQHYADEQFRAHQEAVATREDRTFCRENGNA